MNCNNNTCVIPNLKTSNSKTCVSVPHPKTSDDWTIYSASWCGYCRGAIKTLNNHLEDYVYYDVNSYDGAGNVKDALASITNNQKTVPIIFHKGKFVGGYTELKQYLSNNTLSGLHGAISATKSVDREDKEMIDLEKNIKDATENYLKICFDRFELKKCRTQVISGVNYRFKVRTGKDQHLYVQAFRDLEGIITIKKVFNMIKENK